MLVQDNTLFGGGVVDTVKDLGKKAAKGIKDIVSSDVGKAALIAAGGYYLGGGAIGPFFQRAGHDRFSILVIYQELVYLLVAHRKGAAQQKAVGVLLDAICKSRNYKTFSLN